MKTSIFYLSIKIIILFLSPANAEGIDLWRIKADYLVVSKQAISAPSVRLLDPPTVEFFKKFTNVGTIEQGEEQILGVLLNAPLLDSSKEPFGSTGMHYGLQLGNNLWLLIYRDKSNRYEIAKAVEVNGLIFQKEDRKYYKTSIFPSVEALIKKSLE